MASRLASRVFRIVSFHPCVFAYRVYRRGVSSRVCLVLFLRLVYRFAPRFVSFRPVLSCRFRGVWRLVWAWRCGRRVAMGFSCCHVVLGR